MRQGECHQHRLGELTPSPPPGPSSACCPSSPPTLTRARQVRLPPHLSHPRSQTPIISQTVLDPLTSCDHIHSLLPYTSPTLYRLGRIISHVLNFALVYCGGELAGEVFSLRQARRRHFPSGARAAPLVVGKLPDVAKHRNSGQTTLCLPPPLRPPSVPRRNVRTY